MAMSQQKQGSVPNMTQYSALAYADLVLEMEEQEKPGVPEVLLWRSVIGQALLDATNNSSRMEDKLERTKAWAWFSTDNRHFCEVCMLADLDPGYVMHKAREVIKQRNSSEGKRPIKMHNVSSGIPRKRRKCENIEVAV